YNRKEAKDHGEGGILVGAPMEGRVVIVDDVISAGTSVRESVEIIRANGATPVGVLIALDRMEKGGTADQPAQNSATQEVLAQYGMPVVSIANLADLLSLLEQTSDQSLSAYRQAVADYRNRWGVT
ncbi:MAG: phosphoribosyltransferase family protein, partial [Burkholderiaceae bacterium]